jgi:hypothetical protein
MMDANLPPPSTHRDFNKYPTKLRPKKEFKSNYEQAMAERGLVEDSVFEDNQPPSDLEVGPKTTNKCKSGGGELAADKAVHFWVLVLPGTRDVATGFFIEPSTGNRVDFGSPYYYEVVSVWNQENYWVNMEPEQVIKNGGKNISLST